MVGVARATKPTDLIQTVADYLDELEASLQGGVQEYMIMEAFYSLIPC